MDCVTKAMGKQFQWSLGLVIKDICQAILFMLSQFSLFVREKSGVMLYVYILPTSWKMASELSVLTS